MGTGVGAVLLELHELLKLYNSSCSAGADASETAGAVLLELLKLYRSSSAVGADASGTDAVLLELRELLKLYSKRQTMRSLLKIAAV